jgi:CheY-like chemotaxis protein
MGRILVVEDDTDSRMMLGKLVDLSGHDLAFATNGWEALLTIDNGNVDLILLDLRMPGMDGPTFLRILQQGAKQRKIPVAVVTALDGADASKCIGDLATIAVLPKDAHLVDNLLALIQTTLPPSRSMNPNPALDKRIN